MKKRISILLTLALMISTMLPITTYAATNYAKTLDNMKAGDVQKYDKKLPTKGAKKTEKQIKNLLKKIKMKMPGKGNTSYSYTLTFSKNSGGNLEYATKSKSWWQYNSKTKYSTSRYEIKYILFYGGELNNITTCGISTEDKKFNYSYSWDKGQKVGLKYKFPKVSSKTTTTKGPKPTNYRLYKDETVLGQKCMVYSYDLKWNGEKSTYYYYISKKTGLEVKFISTNSLSTYTTIVFDIKNISKKVSFFAPPKNVKFSELETD